MPVDLLRMYEANRLSIFISTVQIVEDELGNHVPERILEGQPAVSPTVTEE